MRRRSRLHPLARRASLVAALVASSAALAPAPGAQIASAPIASAPTASAQTASAQTATAQAGTTPGAAVPLTLDRIMADPDWIGRAPQRPWWSDDSRTIHYTRERAGSDLTDTFSVDLAGRITLVPDAELPGLGTPGGDFDTDHRMKVSTRHGDLFLEDTLSHVTLQLTRTAARESSPLFLEDGRIAFSRDGTLLVRDLGLGTEEQIVDLRGGAEPEEEDAADGDDEPYLEDQQQRLFEIVRLREQRRSDAQAQDEARKEADTTRPPEPWYLGEGRSAASTDFSPRGDLLLVTLGPSSRKSGDRDHMPEWVTASGYVVDREVRSLVGTGQESPQALALLDVVERTRLDVDLSRLPGMHTDPLAAIKAETKALLAERRRAERQAAGSDGDAHSETDAGTDGETAEADGRLKQPRPVSIRGVEWSDDGRRVAFQVFSHDNKDRWTCVLDGDTHALILVEHLHDPAWINWRFNELGWMPGGEAVWLTSERTGFDHVYLADLNDTTPLTADDAPAITTATDDSPSATAGDGPASATAGDEGPDADGDTPDAVTPDPERSEEGGDGIVLRQAALHPLTGGAFEVFSVSVSRLTEPAFPRFVVHARKEHPGITEAYRVDLDLSDGPPSSPPPLERLTHLGGQNTVTVSPDERQLLIRHSTLTSPPELYLQENRPDAQPTRLTFTIEPEFRAVDWAVPEIVSMPSTYGGGTLYARVYTPADDAPGRGDDGLRPAVMFVHGAGYLQNVHFGWSSYFREFMFHSLLVQRGFVVIDIDFRASAGYGRDHRTAIYRRMGTPELEDFADGIDWLVANRGVDRSRIGAYGGSYGGFMVLMALFLKPDMFAAGAALRPVTDWAHYNHGYTSNILNEPEDDVMAYEASSPIEFAEGLSKPLLICHGMIDDNVFFKDTVRLAQRLIELEKDDWEVALFPIEPHSFVEPSSWRDEYSRILKLFETHLR